MKSLDSRNVKFSENVKWKCTWKCKIYSQYAIFYIFDPPEKSVFELMTNLKSSFSESGPLGSVHVPQKPIFLFKFSNF